jgi:hypothetical protein
MAFFCRASDWTQSILGLGGDPIAYVWFLNWWPFAITHHLNPFISTYVWHPEGANMVWFTTVPSAALLGWPITLLGGPILTYNLWTLLAPALSAWTAFLLARYLTKDWGAALFGGYLFGFSSYELGQLLGHLAIDVTFLVPLVVLLCVQRVRGEISRGRFIACLAPALVIELGLSTEVLASLCVLGAIVWVIFVIFASPADRPGLRRLATDILLTAPVAIALASPFLFYAVLGLPDVPLQINSSITYSADLLNYVVPTIVSLLGGVSFESIASRFTGNASEQGAYLGLPLIVLLACYFLRASGRYSRALLVTLIVLVVLSLGPRLQIGGQLFPVPLPWALAAHVPLIRQALPMRFTLFVALTAAIIAALYLAAAGSRRQRILRFALAILACVALVPDVSIYTWERPPKLPFFTPQNIAQALGHMPNVMILPHDLSARSLAWQLDAGMGFTQSPVFIGYMPKAEQTWSLLWQLDPDSLAPTFGNDLAAYCVTHRVSHILITPDTEEPLVAAIAAQHWPQHSDKGVTVVEVPPASELRYSYVNGDYWPTAQPLGWMGRRVTVVTHGLPLVMTLTGALRLVKEPVTVTVTSNAKTTVYHMVQSDTKTIELPADADVLITADTTFVPDRIIHNGDGRALSVAIALEPPPEGSRSPPAR